jgi:hypothetical protein
MLLHGRVCRRLLASMVLVLVRYISYWSSSVLSVKGLPSLDRQQLFSVGNIKLKVSIDISNPKQHLVFGLNCKDRIIPGTRFKRYKCTISSVARRAQRSWTVFNPKENIGRRCYPLCFPKKKSRSRPALYGSNRVFKKNAFYTNRRRTRFLWQS